MYLSRLSIRHYRNLGVQRLEFPPIGAAIIGENAQGKTNLLEAIYYLETFRSFRGTSDDQVIAFDEDGFRLVGGVRSGEEGSEESLEVAAAFERQGRRKKVSVQGVEPERLADAVGRLGVVIFSPEDVAVVSEGPALRRRFLDIVLSLNEPGYLRALQRYRQILEQRNAALREEAPPAAVQAWDEGLARAGVRVVEARDAWVRDREEMFGRYYAGIADGPPARMEYQPAISLDGATGDEGLEAYLEQLESSRERERRRQTTVVGPHRDEVRFTLEGTGGPLEVREYASAGERRTAAVALRLVEAATIQECRGQDPIVLLDDVFAELDGPRAERVLEVMEAEEAGQVIVTAPKESDVRIRAGTLPRWTIREGVIRT